MCLFPSTPDQSQGPVASMETTYTLALTSPIILAYHRRKKPGKADATLKKEPCRQRVADDKAPVYLSSGELIQRAEVRHL